MKTTTTTNNVIPSTPNPKQPQQRRTAKEIIAANVKELIAQLEAGHSNALTAYLDAMSRFHNYSFGNVLEIARQRPDATRVAGLYAWNQLGRKVKRGEKGNDVRCHGRSEFAVSLVDVLDGLLSLVFGREIEVDVRPLAPALA